MSLIASSSRTARLITRTLSQCSSSRPINPAALSRSVSSAPPKPKAVKRPVSAYPAGTVLPGLNILKDQPEVVARADEDYPDWLWTLLDAPPQKAAGADKNQFSAAGLKNTGDYMEQKRQLRALNRSNIKAANYLKTT